MKIRKQRRQHCATPALVPISSSLGLYGDRLVVMDGHGKPMPASIVRPTRVFKPARRTRSQRLPRPGEFSAHNAWTHGPFRIALDGVEVSRVVIADTRKGLVRVTGEPARLDKHGKRIRVHTLRGTVTVAVGTAKS